MEAQTIVTLQQADLIHLPIFYERAEIQQFYYDMSRKLYGGYASLSFIPGNIELFTVYGNGGSSRCMLLPDRFRIVESNSGIKPEDFKSRFEVTMASASAVFGVTNFPLQTVKIVAVSQPLLWDDAVDFLACKICGMEPEDLAAFGRRASAFTMNFRFLATSEEHNNFNVKIEAIEPSQKSVVMEVEGTFSELVTPQSLALGAANVQKTYDFIGQRLLGFLNRHDKKPED
jgi:hypothetical protein